MRKLLELREFLLNGNYGIKAKNLLTFAEKGVVKSWQGGHGHNGNFLIEYTAHVIVTDYPGDGNPVFFGITTWLEANQTMRESENAIDFHVDVLDSRKVDLSIQLQLSEAIEAQTVDGGTNLSPLADNGAYGFDMSDFYPGMNNG